MLKTIHDKKTYLANILKQFVLTKLLWKKDQRVFTLFEDHLSEIHHCKKKMQCFTQRSISTLIN